jgi:hypothetical protein
MKIERGRVITGWRNAVPPKAAPSFRKTAKTTSATERVAANATEANLVKTKA